MRLSLLTTLSIAAMMTACGGASVEGSWSGTTSDCANADFNDGSVTIVVDGESDTAALTTVVGLPTDRPYSFTQDGGALEDPSRLAFVTTTKTTDNGETVEYTVDLSPADDGESHSGTFDIVADGGASSRCQLTVTR